MTDDTLVEVNPPSNTLVTVTGVATVVVAQQAVSPTIIETGGGGGGAAVDPNMFYQVLLYLAELDNETKKHTARTNLGLATVDGGVFT